MTYLRTNQSPILLVKTRRKPSGPGDVYGDICEMAVQTSSLVNREVSCSFISGVTLSCSTSRHSSIPTGSEERTTVVVIQKGTANLWGLALTPSSVIISLIRFVFFLWFAYK
jgi:hypothetical protein